MPKLSLEFAVDFGSLTKELEKAESKSKEAFANIGEGAAVGAITSAFRDIAEQVEAMSGASEKFNKTWSDGLKTDEKRLSIAKEMLKTQAQIADLEKHERQAQEAQGRGGGRDGAAGGGGLGGRRGGGMNRGISRAQGVIGAGFGLLNQASGGLGTTSDILDFGSSIASTAGQAAGAAAVLGMGSKLLGPIGVGLYAVGEGLKFAAKMSRAEEQHGARAISAYAGGGEEAYNAYMQAQHWEYGYGRQDTPGGSYGFRKYGITPTAGAGMIAGMGRASEGAVVPGNMESLSALHRLYGASAEGIGLMGVAQRTGGLATGRGQPGGDMQSKLFAKAMGVALATEMSHGRIGESFEQIGSVATQLSKRGDVNLDVVMGMVTAIGRMGDRYQGTGIGAQQAVGTLEGLTQSKTAYGYTQNYLRLQQENPDLDAFGVQAKIATQGASDYMQKARELKGEAARLLVGTDGSEAAKWNITGRLASFHGVPPGNMRAFHDILWKLVMADAGNVVANARGGLDALRADPPEGPGMDRLRTEGGAAAWDLGAYRTGGPRRVSTTGYEEARTSVQNRAAYDARTRGYEAREATRPEALGAPTGVTESDSSFSEQNAEYRSSATRAGTKHLGLRYNRRDKATGKYRDLLPGELPRKHKGEDIYPPDMTSTSVFAPHDGLVDFVRREPRAGMTVKLVRDDGRSTIMRHLRDVKVSKGAKVSKGDRIADGLFKFASGTKSHAHTETLSAKGKQLNPAGEISFDDVFGGQLGIGKPGDMDPTSGEVPADAGAPQSGAGADGSTAPGVSAVVAPSASGGVSVALTITDRTSAGVSVAEASRSHTQKAAQPSPGDIPSLYNREGA